MSAEIERLAFRLPPETEYEILRTLIDGGYIPDDVTIQVLVQAREHLIKKTFEAIKGAKNVIVHFYNSTSTLQRKVVFKTDMQGVIDIAVNGAKLIKELTDKELAEKPGYEYRYEYSLNPLREQRLIMQLKSVKRLWQLCSQHLKNPIILNLPSTVEGSSRTDMRIRLNISAAILKTGKVLLFLFIPHNDRGEGALPQQILLF